MRSIVSATVLLTIAACLSAVGGLAEIFSDGFESGDTSQWSPPGEFSPQDIENLWGWWDAGLDVTEVGGRVAQWSDQSGNGREWIQPSEANRPDYFPFTHGDRPAIEWKDENDAWFELADFINPAESDIEVFILARRTLDIEWAALIHQRSDDFGVGRAWLYFSGDDIISFIGGGETIGIDAIGVYDPAIYHASFDFSAQTLEVFKNGQSLALSTGVVGEDCEGGLYFGRDKDGGSIEGFVYEVIVYDRALDPGERESVLSYIQNKWSTVWPEAAASPTEVGDPWAWWQADNGVTVGAGGVESWSDLSGNGLILVQSETERRPQLTPNAQNGLPGITFDDIDDHLETLADTIDFAIEDATIFVVMNTEDTGDAAPIGGLDGPTGIGRAWFENEPGVGRVYIGGHPPPISLNGGRVTGPAILTVFYDGERGVTQYAVNQWIWGMASGVVGEANSDGGIRVGDTKSDLNDLNGDIYEIVLFNRALSWTERELIINYLNDKWSIF